MFEVIYDILVVLGVITLVIAATVVVAVIERLRRDRNGPPGGSFDGSSDETEHEP